MQEIFIYFFLTKDDEQFHFFIFFMQGPQLSATCQISKMISKLFQAPDAKMLNRANETLRTNFSQNLISPWSEIGVKLYSKINTGMSNNLNKSYRKWHRFLSSCFSIFLPSNGLELNREVEDPWIIFPMVQLLSWLEL